MSTTDVFLISTGILSQKVIEKVKKSGHSFMIPA